MQVTALPPGFVPTQGREDDLNVPDALNAADAPDAPDAVNQQDQAAAASAQDQGGLEDYGASTLNALRQLRPENPTMALLAYQAQMFAQSTSTAASTPAPTAPTAARTAQAAPPAQFIPSTQAAPFTPSARNAPWQLSAYSAQRPSAQAARQQARIGPPQGYLADLKGIAQSNQPLSDKLKMAWHTTQYYWRNLNTSQSVAQTMGGNMQVDEAGCISTEPGDPKVCVGPAAIEEAAAGLAPVAERIAGKLIDDAVDTAAAAAKGTETAATGAAGTVAKGETATEAAINSGSLSGTPARIGPLDDAETIRGRTRENESAAILAENGYDVVQNPAVSGSKNPDYLLNGDIFDNYAPSTGNVRNIADVISGKVADEQADNVVVNLADSPATPAALQSQMDNYPIPGLKHVIVIDQSGLIIKLNIKGN
jgi:hypothetical protein